MKKIITILLLFFACSASLIFINTTSVKANTIETASYGDAVVRTALAEGGFYTGHTLVDYSVKYGNVENNDINSFTTYSASESSWSGILGKNSDNAYAETWKINSKNNVGVILEVVAKKDINISATYSAFSGWIDNSELNVYVKSNDSTTLISSKTLSGATGNTPNSVDDFALNLNLISGETLYYEFISIGDSHRNIQGVTGLNFTFKEGVVEDLPTGTPTITKESFKYSDIILKTAENNGDSATGNLVKYGLFYGNVSATNISLNKFTTFTVDGNGGATLGTTSDDVYCPNAGQVYYGSKSGVSQAAIVKITALYNVSIDVNRTVLVTLGWTDQTVLSVYVESEGTITEVKNFELVSPTVNDFSLTDVKLKSGDSIYYVLKYMYNDGGSRNAQDLGYFVFDISYEREHTHNYGEWNHRVEATCDTDGTLGHYLCECGKFFDEEYNELSNIVIAASHAYSKTYSSDETHHWYKAVCEHQNEKFGYAEHTFDLGVVTIEPTPTVEGIKTFTCTECNYKKEVNLGTSGCAHTFSSDYSYDEEGHWNEATCGCDEIRNYAQHTFTWETIEEGNYIVDRVEKGTCECGYFILSKIDSEINFPDYSVLDTISLQDLAIYNSIYEGQAITLANMQVNLKQGNVMSNHIVGFEKYLCDVSYAENGKQSINVLIGSATEEDFYSEESAAFSTWRMRTSLAKHAIFEITATTNIKLDITHAAFEGGWIDEHGQFIAIYILSGDMVYTISLKDIKENFGEANQYGGSLMLKEGDVCYWVFGSTIANQRNVNIVPTFTASTEDYNETQYNNQMVVGDEIVSMWDAVTATINNDYNAASYNLIDFGFGFGSVNNINKFNYHVGDGTGTAADALWDSVSEGVGFLRWQIQCDVDADAIMTITAKYNLSLTVNHSASAWSNVWSTHTAVRYYVIDTDGTRVLVLDKSVESKVPEDFFTININLLKGQSLIIDYYTKTDSFGSLDFAPVITASCESFDESKVIDFSTVRALSTKITEAIETVNSMFDELDESDYSISNWGKLENYYDEALSSLDAAQSEQDIANALNALEENIAKTKTKAEELVVLNEAKEKAISELNALVNSLDKENYSSENWNLITSKLEDATKKINNATSQTSINTLLTSAKTYINNIKPQEKSSKGCGGSVAGSCLMLFTLVAAVCYIKNKKEKKFNGSK